MAPSKKPAAKPSPSETPPRKGPPASPKKALKFSSPAKGGNTNTVRIYATTSDDIFIEVDKKGGDPAFMKAFQDVVSNDDEVAAAVGINSLFNEREVADYHSYKNYEPTAEYKRFRPIFTVFIDPNINGSDPELNPLAKPGNRLILGRNLAKIMTKVSLNDDKYKQKFVFEGDSTPANFADRASLGGKATFTDAMFILVHTIYQDTMTVHDILMETAVMKSYFGKHVVPAWKYFANNGKITHAECNGLVAAYRSTLDPANGEEEAVEEPARALGLDLEAFE